MSRTNRQTKGNGGRWNDGSIDVSGRSQGRLRGEQANRRSHDGGCRRGKKSTGTSNARPYQDLYGTFVEGSGLGDWKISRERCKYHRSFQRVGEVAQQVQKNTENSRCSTFGQHRQSMLNNAVSYAYPDVEQQLHGNTEKKVDLADESLEVVLLTSGRATEVILDEQPNNMNSTNLMFSCMNSEVMPNDDSTYGLGYKMERSFLQTEEYGQDDNVAFAPNGELGRTCREINQGLHIIKEGQTDFSVVTAIRKGELQGPVRAGGQKKLRNSFRRGDEAFLSIGNVRVYVDQDVEWSKRGEEKLNTVPDMDESELDLSGDEWVSLTPSSHKTQNWIRKSSCENTCLSKESSTSGCDDLSDSSHANGHLSSSDIDEELAEDYIACGGGDLADLNRIWNTDRFEQIPVEDRKFYLNFQTAFQKNDSSGISSGLDDFEDYKGADLDTELLQQILFEEESGENSLVEDEADDDLLIDKEEVHFRDLSLGCRNKDGGKDVNRSLGNTSQKNGRKEIRVRGRCPSNNMSLDCKLSKKMKGIPGWKKRHHKEMIAAKRRQRALEHGFDLTVVNAMLEDVVLKEVDTFAFEPMSSKHCVKVQKLASVYHLRSGIQRSGKKWFVIVTRTNQTCLPCGFGRDRLLNMLGQNSGVEQTFKLIKSRSKCGISGEKRHMPTNCRLVDHKALQSMDIHPGAHSQHIVSRKANKRRGPGRNKRNANYASQPMLFISNGIMAPESHFSENLIVSASTSSVERVIISKTSGSAFENSLQLGDFEAYTKGFGSRMMAKMGFVEGCGLGKDGQGIIQPLKPIRRPKSLGLGA